MNTKLPIGNLTLSERTHYVVKHSCLLSIQATVGVRYAQYTPPMPTRRDATKQFRRVGVGGVYWALEWMVQPTVCRTVLSSTLYSVTVSLSNTPDSLTIMSHYLSIIINNNNTQGNVYGAVSCTYSEQFQAQAENTPFKDCL